MLSRLKNFFRFSIREFLVFIVTFAMCVAVNRDVSLGQFIEICRLITRCWNLVLLPLLASRPIFVTLAFLYLLVWLYQERDRPGPLED